MALTIIYIVFSIVFALIEYMFITRDSNKLSQKTVALIANWASGLCFVTIFLNFPVIAIWQYMRKNDFLASEALDYNYLYNYIGLDFIILNILIVYVLPLLLFFSNEKTGRVIGGIFLFMYFVFIVLGLIFTTNITLPTSLFFVSVFLYIWGLYSRLAGTMKKIKDGNYSPKQQFSWQSLSAAGILVALIIVPSLTLEDFTKKTLNRMKLGGFNVTIRTDDKRVLEGFLLLKTRDFYYLHPKCKDKTFEKDVVIIHTANTTLAYKRN